MAYEMVMPYHLHMPSYFLETFTEYPFIKNETSARKDESGQKFRFSNMDCRSIIPVILSL